MSTQCVAFFNFPGGMEWFWIFLIFLILFGAAALPKLFRSLGKSVREFKKAQEGLYDEMEKAADKDDRAKAEGQDSAGAAKKPDRPTNGDA